MPNKRHDYYRDARYAGSPGRPQFIPPYHSLESMTAGDKFPRQMYREPPHEYYSNGYGHPIAPGSPFMTGEYIPEGMYGPQHGPVIYSYPVDDPRVPPRRSRSRGREHDWSEEVERKPSRGKSAPRSSHYGMQEMREPERHNRHVSQKDISIESRLLQHVQPLPASLEQSIWVTPAGPAIQYSISTDYRNPLHQWGAMRTSINEGLAESIVNNRYRDIPVTGQQFDDLVRPSRKSRHGVYHYSTAIDQGTTLQKEEYVNFGIPRARATNLRSSSSDSSSSESESESEGPFYSINKLKRDKSPDRKRQPEPVYAARPSAENGYARPPEGRRLKVYRNERKL